MKTLLDQWDFRKGLLHMATEERRRGPDSMIYQYRKMMKKGSLHSANHQCFVILLAPLDSCETHVAILSCESASKTCDIPSTTELQHKFSLSPDTWWVWSQRQSVRDWERARLPPGVQGSPMAPSVSASFSGTGILCKLKKLKSERTGYFKGNG